MVQLGGPLGLSLAQYIFKKPGLHKFVKPWANVFVNASGYRKVGLRYDDLRESFETILVVRKCSIKLVIEETDDVQKVL